MGIEVINVSSRGQIVIPERMRKSLGIKQGSKLIAIEKEGSLILKKESDMLESMEYEEKKEEIGWLALAEKSLSDVWDNKKDDEVWGRYLDD
ncbi:MAG TPA: AbrB/MazE/SpoVT family DNA-binding domain-containing protein [Candidatus Nanoarchaeia archaeon]|nr:AbrB/MazE/SpoVT family DNA-binding domain-containing protein [Candidatus Nanoarchaeia archaeon]